MSSETINTFYYRYLRHFLAKDDSTATLYDKYMALAYAVRNHMVDPWIESQKQYHVANARRVYYLSMEYVFGKSLKHNIVNLGLEDDVEQAARDLGFSLEDIYEQEDDADLGNGGKGRLAACFQDAIASYPLAGMGYGLHYDYAVFRQQITGGRQTELPYDWLHKGHPWEIVRPEYACRVNFYKDPQACGEKPDNNRESDLVVAMPFDLPVPGYRNQTVNTVRLWSARAAEEFLADYQNHGDYVRACEEKSQTGRISKVLFPDEDVRRVTELRVKQQYFFASASLQDIIRRYKQHNAGIRDFAKKVVIQLNGSRTAIAIPEMMRLLVDVEGLAWEEAWKITRHVFTYTSHAVNRESLESWPVYLMEQVLPRHMAIIYDINQRHLDIVAAEKNGPKIDPSEVSLIEEGEVKRVRMAHLAVLGSFSVNGVSRIQSDALVKKVFSPFADIVPSSFGNKTNGIAHRRWLLCANRPLASLITEAIGDKWTRDAEYLAHLADFADDEAFLFRLGDVKHAAKRHLAEVLKKWFGISLDHRFFFDVQCKKIHPYKRQALHVLYVLTRFLRIKNGIDPGTQRCHLFSGKATPSDHLAKQVIHLINLTSELVNNDPDTEGKLSIQFLPGYCTSLAEVLVPAADLSEQIATVGLEASATSNMKFAVNGAVTMASPAGSNLEMMERVGEENMVVFGKTAEELASIGAYSPQDIINGNQELAHVLSYLEENLSRLPQGEMVYPLVASLRDNDQFGVVLDYADYVAKQDSVDALYADRRSWMVTCLKNIANVGWFSADRTAAEYATEVWKVTE